MPKGKKAKSADELYDQKMSTFKKYENYFEKNNKSDAKEKIFVLII